MIPDDVVEEVRARADIVDIIGEFVQLKKAGKDYKGLSPFQDERTPSFYVVPAKGFFHDFSSGESGDVFSFLMKHQGMSFLDAVKFVGARSGVEVREVTRGGGQDDPLRPYYEATAYAKAFYAERLWDDKGGATAREYVASRGIERDVAERYGLGYAPDDWRELRSAAAVHGLDEAVLFDLGLLKKSEKKSEPYDAFRNRIVFPIESLSGRAVAFGGRLLGASRKGAPKYLNSPESPIYHKSDILYGMGWAKNHIRRDDQVLVVEGYMDVVSLGAVGVNTAVAPLGTSLTTQHADLIKRYTKKVLLLFDSDPAGLRATFRAADLLLSKGLHPAVVTFPEGEDPDSVAQSEGAEGVQTYLRQAVDVLDRKIQMLEERDYFSSIEKTRGALDRLLPTLRAVTDPTLRDLYLAKIEERTGVRRDTLVQELAQPNRAPSFRQPPPRVRHVPRIPKLGAERTLLLLMLKDRNWIERAAERLGPADLEDPINRAMFEALVDDPGLSGPPEDMDPGVASRLESLMADPEEPTPSGRVFEEAVSRIRVVGIDRRLEELDERIHGTADEDERLRLVKEKLQLTRERQEFGTDWRKSVRSALKKDKGKQAS
ncbi:MAG: DNA primase [Longimicrobiales bacterium]